MDDDADVRQSIGFMLEAAGYDARGFADGYAFLGALPGLEVGCILLDVRMPRKDGFQVMDALAKDGIDWPTVIMTGHGEVPVAVRAMKQGAIDFIEKPFGEDTLLSALERGFAVLDARGDKAEAQRAAKERVARLSVREREVLQGLVGGASNKLLAVRLGISLRTVEMHRANMMDRLGVASLAEALTLAVQGDLPPLPEE